MNVAGFFACWGVAVELIDLDPQSSCLDWLETRPQSLPRIAGDRSFAFEPAHKRGIDYRVIDVPSSCFDDATQTLLVDADTVIIPLMASINDFRATMKFLKEVEKLRNRIDGKNHIGFVANRIKHNTRSFSYLKEFVRQTDIPCRGVLRDTQNYVRAAESGLSIFELPGRAVASDLRQWQRIIRWLCMDQSVSVHIPLPVAYEQSEF